MRDVASFYWNQPTAKLRQWRSQKYNRVLRLREKFQGYLVLQEIKTLNFQIQRIDAILAARAAQMELPE